MEKLLKRREIDDDDEHDAILRDGQSIRVPLSMMDAAQLSIAEDNALHKPGSGNPSADATARREEAAADYDRLVGQAWQQGKPASPAPSNDVEAAYQQYDDRIQNLWKQGKA